MHDARSCGDVRAGRTLLLALAALAAGCAEEDGEGEGGIPTLVVSGGIVETHQGNGDATSPVCSYDPGYRGDPRAGAVDLSTLAQRLLAEARAVALLSIRLETDDDSLCGAGHAILLVPADATNVTLVARSAGVEALGDLAVEGDALIVDGQRLEPGASVDLRRNGTRQSGFEGDFDYEADLVLEHAGCWRVEGARFVERECA